MGTQPTQFSAHVYCGQTAAWIKMPLGTEVGIDLRDVVFNMEPATPRKRAHPIFGPCLLWPNGWIGEDAAWYGSRPGPRPHCTRRGPSSRERISAAPPPLFGPCLLWPRSPISATAEVLFKFIYVSYLTENRSNNLYHNFELQPRELSLRNATRRHPV